MQNNKIKYKKIINNLIKKSFPELKNKKIYVFETRNKKFSAISLELLYLKIIFVSIKSKKYSVSALKGLFAHELSHFSIIENMSFLENISYFWRFPFSKNVRANFETKADKLVIEKDLEKELIALKKEDAKKKNKKDLENKLNRGYLSPSQIKAYAKKIK
jgi:hypothetical protein